MVIRLLGQEIKKKKKRLIGDDGKVMCSCRNLEKEKERQKKENEGEWKKSESIRRIPGLARLDLQQKIDRGPVFFLC